MNKLLFVSLSIIMLFACKSSKKQVEEDPSISFKQEESFSDLLDRGLEQDKMIFLDFYTDWCLPCKMMEEDVFSDKAIGEFFNENFINMKVDAEKNEGPDLSLIYNVSGFPTLIFVNGKGQEILRKEGMVYHTELMNFANQAILESQNQ